MPEPAGSTARGTEISERSTELVLPDGPAIEDPVGSERIVRGVEGAGPATSWTRRPLAQRATGDADARADAATRGATDPARPARHEPEQSEPERRVPERREEVGVNESELTTTRESGGRWRTLSTSPPEKRPRADDDAQPARAAASESSAAEADASIRGAAASEARPHGGETAPEGEAADPDRGTRGLALPGDRGPRRSAADAPRPSFWRRIALGRRARREHDLDPQPTAQAAPGPREAFASSETAVRSPAPTEPPAPTRPTTREPSSAVAPATPSVPAVETIEKRVVEPMLQALVSVEAKLERSHTDLSTRSDHISQRLTQLWEIEEQLGALGEIQESLLQVGEQQRRLESAFLAQTRTLRWLVGAVFFSLVAAAFVVAALLR